ncbi:MAG TPA: hypothetical protein DCM14_07290 [Clostridiales bacterium UBA8153]|nr:hypothetical protein [Clostridiales bacterium UBA8153]
MSFWERFEGMDPRYMYVFLALALLIPVFRPVGMPIAIDHAFTQPMFDWIERELRPDSLLILDTAYSPGAAAELDPQLAAIFRHLMRRGHKVVLISQWELGARLGTTVVRRVADAVGAEYGVDWVSVGWREGGLPWMRSLQDDFWAGMGGVDIDGVPFERLPLMQRLRAFRPGQVDGIICFVTGSPGAPTYITWFPEIRLHLGATAVMVPGLTPQLVAGQTRSLLTGLRGAAEYEVLIGEPGRAVKLMDAQSLGHLIIMALIILSNIGYAIRTRQGAT